MTTTDRGVEEHADPGVPALVWYVAYGSNLSGDRFGCYLSGGRPVGAGRTYTGARDKSTWRESRAAWLPGGTYFALTSTVWGGSMAFYDPTLPGPTPARAYLVTVSQFSDVVAQEMHRPVGTDLDLRVAISTGRHELGPGCYETLLCPGRLDGHPLLTFTAPWPMAQVTPGPPAPAYVDMIAAGLVETHGWDVDVARAHLRTLPGAAR